MKNSDMEFGESKSRQVWETPSRSTLVKPKSAGLSRGPSLTFTDQGPKIIARKPPSSGLVESVQDFLIKLDVKPCMHLSSENKHFLVNLVIVRLTKIMNRADKNWALF